MEGSRNSVEKIAYRLRSSFNRCPQKFRDTLAKTCGALLVIGCFLWGATATYGSERAQENGPEEGSTVSASPKEEAIMVILHTNYGDITLELYPDKAPNTVSNFLRYVDEGFYNGTIFHRVIDGFMIQGGGLTPDLHPKQTHPPIPNEATNGLKNLRGTVAMARTTAIDSATSQFFINVVDNSFLDHTAPTPAGFGYCVFGKVVKGMDVVDKIKRVPTTTVGPFQNVPVDPVIIISASRLPETSAP